MSRASLKDLSSNPRYPIMYHSLSQGFCRFAVCSESSISSCGVKKFTKPEPLPSLRKNFFPSQFSSQGVKKAILQPKVSVCVSNGVVSAVAVSSRLDKFNSWLQQEGILTPDKSSVVPASVPEGLGLVARRNIGSFDEVFAVPEALVISNDAAAISPIGSAIKELKPWVSLALFLIHEKANPASRWAPYLSILPEVMDLPVFWTDEELLELEGTQFLSTVESYKQLITSQFESLQETIFQDNPSLFPSSTFTSEAFFWAFGILRSRTFSPFIGENIALVPFADLTNHGIGGIGCTNSWETRSLGIFDRKQIVSMKAGKSFPEGNQVYMEYGKDKSNSQLALDFGFAEKEGSGAQAGVGGRSRDTFTVTLQLSEGSAFYDDKAGIAEQAGFVSSVFYDVVRGEGPPEEMVAFLRLIALSGQDVFLLEAIFRGDVWRYLSLPVSRENEEAVCQAMIDGCSAALELYPTDVEQDIRTLNEGGLSRRLETAIIVRLGEKRVLTELLDWFVAREQRLGQLEYYQERRLKDLGLLDDEGSMTAWISR